MSSKSFFVGENNPIGTPGAFNPFLDEIGPPDITLQFNSFSNFSVTSNSMIPSFMNSVSFTSTKSINSLYDMDSFSLFPTTFSLVNIIVSSLIKSKFSFTSPIRIFGPDKSIIIGIVSSTLLTNSNLCLWSSMFPCDIFNLTTSSPFSINFLNFSSSDDDGPKVPTIAALLLIFGIDKIVL